MQGSTLPNGKCSFGGDHFKRSSRAHDWQSESWTAAWLCCCVGKRAETSPRVALLLQVTLHVASPCLPLRLAHTHTHPCSPTQLLYINQTLRLSLHRSAAPDVPAGPPPLPSSPLLHLPSFLHPLSPFKLLLLFFHYSSFVLIPLMHLLSEHPR